MQMSSLIVMRWNFDDETIAVWLKSIAVNYWNIRINHQKYLEVG